MLLMDNNEKKNMKHGEQIRRNQKLFQGEGDVINRNQDILNRSNPMDDFFLVPCNGISGRQMNPGCPMHLLSFEENFRRGANFSGSFQNLISPRLWNPTERGPPDPQGF